MNEIQLTPELLRLIGDSFHAEKTPKNVKTRPCRIKFNGKFITTLSRKTIWRNKGFAKSALLNHLNSAGLMHGAIKALYHKSYISSADIKAIIRQLEEQWLIEYVEVDIEDFAVAKK